MAKRPNDWGDQYPSDLNDTPPLDPTANFQEVDYSIDSLSPKKRDTEGDAELAFDPPVENEPLLKRNVRFALILKKADPPVDATINFPQFYIVLQTGHRTWGYVTNKLLYEQIMAGDDVAVIKDQVDKWIIVGRTHPRELPVIEMTNSGSAQGSNVIVPFNTVVTKTPIDNTFGGYDEVRKGPSRSVECNGEKEALYEVQFTITLEQAEPMVEVDYLYVQAGCWEQSQFPYITGNRRTPKLFFNRQVGLDLQYDSSTCTFGLTIKSSVRDSILNQQSTSRNPRWTDTPKIGNSLQVGSQVAVGWLKLQNRFGAYAWLTHGNGAIKVQLWANPPAFSPSFAIGIANGVCTRLLWQKAGGTGTICVKTCTVVSYSYCYNAYDNSYCYTPNFGTATYVVQNGLIMSGPGLQFAGIKLKPFCPESPEKKHDPCGLIQ